MGRLNYTNRKAEGLKLGQIVNKDLVKRIPPHTGSKAAFRDPTVDLDVSGKTLTDEGFLELSPALVEALSYNGIQGRCTRLEELCLKRNGLSCTSLKALTSIIELACHDLRDLDLSGNQIHINTKTEITIWERFLTSFESCRTLRRIDLSGNALGPRGYEILLRVYAKERSTDLVLNPEIEQQQDQPQDQSVDNAEPKPRRSSLTPEAEDYGSDSVDDPVPPKRKGSRQNSKVHEMAELAAIPAGPLLIFAPMQGLRSVPYLVLCNTAMTDTCALHLSFIIENHQLPEKLLTRIPPPKAGAPAQQIIAYDESGCRGIVYQPNIRLGSVGHRVLELAERRRDQKHYDTSQADSQRPADPFESKKFPRRPFEVGFAPSSVTVAKRRRSIQIGALDSGGASAELDRARSKIQGNSLQEDGPFSNELWRAALKMLATGRHLSPHSGRNVPDCSSVPKPKAPMIKTLTVPEVGKAKILRPHTPLRVEKDPNQPMTPWNTISRKRSDGILPMAQMNPPTPMTRKDKDKGSDNALQEKKLSRVANVYRTSLPCGFSEYAWAKILGYRCGAEGILSNDQQLSVLRYATDRNTLRKEREALGLAVATQIWRILEATGCLAYKVDL